MGESPRVKCVDEMQWLVRVDCTETRNDRHSGEAGTESWDIWNRRSQRQLQSLILTYMTNTYNPHIIHSATSCVGNRNAMSARVYDRFEPVGEPLKPEPLVLTRIYKAKHMHEK